jgi:hypothetical protein
MSRPLRWTLISGVAVATILSIAALGVALSKDSGATGPPGPQGAVGPAGGRGVRGPAGIPGISAPAPRQDLVQTLKSLCGAIARSQVAVTGYTPDGTFGNFVRDATGACPTEWLHDPILGP